MLVLLTAMLIVTYAAFEEDDLQSISAFTRTNETKIEENLSAFSKCPKRIDSITYVTHSEWLMFLADKIYRILDRKFVDNGNNISEVFPKGPKFVNASVTSNDLIVLFAERAIYGYEYDGVSFIEAPGFPKELHDRVLFYPQAAFPLNNGSVILLSGNVFATYNVLENRPSFLNDKARVFPNIPEDLRSGIPKDIQLQESYWMFEEKTVSDYDMSSKQVLQIESVAEFFECS